MCISFALNFQKNIYQIGLHLKCHCWLTNNTQPKAETKRLTCQIMNADFRETRSFIYSANTQVCVECALSSAVLTRRFTSHILGFALHHLAGPRSQHNFLPPLHWPRAVAHSSKLRLFGFKFLVSHTMVLIPWASCSLFLSFCSLICKTGIMIHLPLKVTLNILSDDIYPELRSELGISVSSVSKANVNIYRTVCNSLCILPTISCVLFCVFVCRPWEILGGSMLLFSYGYLLVLRKFQVQRG